MYVHAWILRYLASSIFGNSAIFEEMYVSIFRASLVKPASSA